VGILIDTSVLIAIERGLLSREVVTEDAAISVITVSELLHGVRRGSGPRRIVRQATVTGILGEFPIVDVTTSIARVHSEIWAALEAKGTLVAAHDLWIGASAVTHGLGVLTRDVGDFARIPGLRVVAV
jgi:tRNA(fMet)-specific endonuclease VapC